MFTGLIETTGLLQSRSGSRLTILPQKHWSDLQYGESIAVNGCCLTLESSRADGILQFFTLEETLRRTNLGQLAPGTPVNLERALRLGDRLGGHIVQGHVDCTAEVLELKRCPDGDTELRIALAREDRELIVEKGSIAIDGVSLTVVEAGKDFFTVRLIPVTLKETALAARRPGNKINLEFDLIGRYVLRHLQSETGEKNSGITMEKLREAGFLS